MCIWYPLSMYDLMHGWSSRRNLLEGSVALNFSYLESARARHSWNMSHENMSWKLRFSALEICLLHYAFFSWTLGTPNAALATVWSGHPREEDVGSGFLCRYSPRPPFGAWICSVQSEMPQLNLTILTNNTFRMLKCALFTRENLPCPALPRGELIVFKLGVLLWKKT